MKHFGRLKTVLIAVAFFCFIAAGFLTMNVMTSCKGNAQICGTCGVPCIGIPGLGVTMTAQITGAVAVPDIALTVAILGAYMDLALAGFSEAIDEKIFEVTQNIVGWIDTWWWYNLKPAMQAMTRQLNTFDTYQDENEGGFADASDGNRVDDEYMKRDMDSHREQRPGENVCVAGTITGGMTRASIFRRAYETSATMERHPRSANDTTNAPTSKSPEADQNSRWQTYVARYCDQNYNAGVAGCAASAPFANRDINVTDEIFIPDTIDLKNPDTQKAVDAILENIAEPTIRDPVLPSAVDSPNGHQAILEGQAYQAKRQVIYDALYYIVSRRAPGSSDAANGKGIKTFLDEIRKSAGLDPGYFTNASPSHNEIMEVMMSERFRSGQMSIDQIDEPENNEREMVVQQAFQAMLMSDELDLLDRYGLVLAAQASGEIKDYRPFNPEQESQPNR